jgi:protein-S-isoprenylcysteine O-methyltransferase Ste14
MFRYIYSMMGWALWCTLHSTLISPFVTKHARKGLGEHFRFYRLTFNLVSLATFIPIAYYSVLIHGKVVFQWEGPLLSGIRYLLLAVVVYLVVAGARHYSLSTFAGFNQIRTGNSNAILSTTPSLDTTGILGAVRHPWYDAAFIFLWSQDLSVSMIMNNLVLTLYIIVGTYLEERKLVMELGEQYRIYQRRVSIFFPYKWIKARFKTI